MVIPTPRKVVYVHNHSPPDLPPELTSLVEFRREVQEEDLTPQKLGNQPAMLILDDVFHNLSDRFCYNLFTSISHHANCSILMVLQHLFMKTRVMRVLSTNAHVTTLFRSPRDMLSLRYLNSQMYPGSPKYLTWAFQDATLNEPYSSLDIDCSPQSDDVTRVRKSSFPGDKQIICYLPESK